DEAEKSAARRVHESQAACGAAGLYRTALRGRPTLGEVPEPLGRMEHPARPQRAAHARGARQRRPRSSDDGLVLTELMPRSITVVGGGFVGVCCALHLQREGFTVRLVEKGEPGMKASFGNSGSFGTASCVPFALPGVLKKVPKMLFDPESPLKLRWS